MSKSSRFLSIATACISFAAISTAMASVAKADQVYVFHNGGMALNTNNSFSKIDGTPRISLWSRNDNDPDQQFTELYSSQNRGVRFMHKSTGLCLNAHYLKDGGSVNLWNCDANDPDQSFTVQDLGGGKSFLKRAGTNFCVDSPTRNANGLIHLIQCNTNNPNQQWMTSKYITVDNQDGNTPYLPFDQGRSLRVDQGWQTTYTHGGTIAPKSKYAIDFVVQNNRDRVGARSAKKGTVSYVGYNDYYLGNHVKIRYSDGSIALYAHLSSVSVQSGQAVNGGQLLGIIGMTGNTGGVMHLHYEERTGDWQTPIKPVFKEKPGWTPIGFGLGEVTSANKDGRK
jgi:hypothetical protein